MNDELSSGFRLKEWGIWPLRNLLNGPGGEQHIEPKAMQVLVALASEPAEVVTREFLLEKVWPDTYSGEVSLTRCISHSLIGVKKDATQPNFEISFDFASGYCRDLQCPARYSANESGRRRQAVLADLPKPGRF